MGKKLSILIILTLFINVQFVFGSEDSRIYKVVGDIQFPPYEYLDEDGIYKGFNVDLLKAISLVTEMEFEFIPMTWENAFYSIERGEADIIQGMKESYERRLVFNFTDSLLLNSQSIFVRDKYYYINGNIDLEGKKVSILKEDIIYNQLKIIKDIDIIEYNSTEEAVKALLNGKVDAMIGNTLTVNYICKENNWIDRVKIVGKALNEQKYSMAVSKNNPMLLKSLNGGLKEIQDNGMYDALYRKWFGTPIRNISKESEMQIQILFISLSILFTITIVIQVINRKLKKIIEDKTEEEKILVNELRNYDKIQFMDKIISSLAHEIRNPLTSVKIYTSQMKNKFDNKEFMLAAAEDIPEEIDRIDRLIKEFMDYTSPRMPQIKVINLKEELQNTIKFISLQIKDIDIFTSIYDDIFIEFDANHLRQIIINILLNSKDALIDSKNPKIIIKALEKGNEINIDFMDNGPGMEEDALNYIFEPFYTTKEKGTGVGMFIVKKLIEENKGKILAKNLGNNLGLNISITVRRGYKDEKENINS